MRPAIPYIYFILPFFLLLPMTSAAQWQFDGVPVCNATGEQYRPAAVSDASGMVVAWEDYRSGNGNIYARKVGMNGAVQWSSNGVAVCTAPDQQLAPAIAWDGVGGTIIVWEDYRSTATSGDIYAQRISSTGQTLWGTNGVLICNEANVQMRPAITGDGQGGAYIAWEDYRTGSGNIFVQHINSSGLVSWTANGIAVATVNGSRYAPVITTASGGGIIVAWEENRVAMEYDVYAQYLNATGARQWGGGALAVCTVTGFQTQIAAAADGGSMLLVWQDYRNATPDIYAQKLTVNGASWQSNGVSVTLASGIQEFPAVAPDGTGGLIATWTDYRVTHGDIYAQRLNQLAVAQWTNNGIAVCTASGLQQKARIAADGNGGAVLSWLDYRISNGDVYAQRLSAAGGSLWQSNGIGVCTTTDIQQSPVVTSDHSGGAVIAWTDYRGQSGDIYAQRIAQSGTPFPVRLLSFSGLREHDGVRLRWQTASEQNAWGFDIQSRKHDGTFRSEGFVPAKSPAGAGYEYHIPATQGEVFRLRIVDLDGSEQ
ncbi:MAG: hypothetical protein KFH87_01855, partial [Bacteroidetes bacterium]|nr:hypothetical protein [Bacteroidota bacterium]